MSAQVVDALLMSAQVVDALLMSAQVVEFNNSWMEELNVLSRSVVNNANAFCKVCHTDFNI